MKHSGNTGETAQFQPRSPADDGAIAPKFEPVQQQDAPALLASICAAGLAGKAIAQRMWVVPGLIPDRNVTDLSGNGGDGKSLLALQLGVAVATATDWIGTKPTPGRFLYMSCEDELDEVHRRLRDICTSKGLEMADLKNVEIVDMTMAEQTELAVTNDNRLSLTPLFEQLTKMVERLKPKLVVLDTRSDVYAGSEIDRGQVRSFVRALRRMCLDHDMAILMISHPSLVGISSGTGQSGSTAWGNSVRSRLYLEKEPDPTLRKLTTKKANYGRNDVTMTLRWEKGVFKPDQIGEGSLDRAAQCKKVEEAFLHHLREFEAQGRNVGPSAGPNFAAAKFAKADGKITKKAFDAAMERLLKARRIRVETYGPPSKNYKKIVEVT